MTPFVEKCIWDSLKLLTNTNLQMERAHRALVTRFTGESVSKPQYSCFHCYKTKEEMLRKAWVMKLVIFDQRSIYFDHDYSPAVHQKRKEFLEAKPVLKENKICF